MSTSIPTDSVHDVSPSASPSPLPPPAPGNFQGGDGVIHQVEGATPDQPRLPAAGASQVAAPRQGLALLDPAPAVVASRGPSSAMAANTPQQISRTAMRSIFSGRLQQLYLTASGLINGTRSAPEARATIMAAARVLPFVTPRDAEARFAFVKETTEPRLGRSARLEDFEIGLAARLEPVKVCLVLQQLLAMADSDAASRGEFQELRPLHELLHDYLVPTARDVATRVLEDECLLRLGVGGPVGALTNGEKRQVSEQCVQFLRQVTREDMTATLAERYALWGYEVANHVEARLANGNDVPARLNARVPDRMPAPFEDQAFWPF